MLVTLPVVSDSANELDYIITQRLMRVRTVTIGKVTAVKPIDEESDDAQKDDDKSPKPVGLCTIQPLVQQTATDGSEIPLAPLYNVPYFRLQGGKNAVVIDPEVDDIGIVLVCDRDITKVKETKKDAVPGSDRLFNFGDALYIGGLLNGKPEQWVYFTAEGIDITSPKAITLTAPKITLTAKETVDVKAEKSATVESPKITLTAKETVGVKAEKSATVESPKITLNADESVTIKSATIVLDGKVEGTSTASFSGDVKGSGISLSGHRHSGVKAGGDMTGGPQ